MSVYNFFLPAKIVGVWHNIAGPHNDPAWRPNTDPSTGLRTFTPGLCLIAEDDPNELGYRTSVALLTSPGGAIVGRVDAPVAAALHGLIRDGTIRIALHLDWVRFSTSSPWYIKIDVFGPVDVAANWPSRYE
jgi:hypothetical protein